MSHVSYRKGISRVLNAMLHEMMALQLAVLSLLKGVLVLLIFLKPCYCFDHPFHVFLPDKNFMNWHITDFSWKSMRWKLENEKMDRHLRAMPLQNKNMGGNDGEMLSKTPATDAISPAVLRKKIFRWVITPIKLAKTLSPLNFDARI